MVGVSSSGETREITHGYRLSRWAGIVERRNASGMSVREFCAERGIAENTYYYWQRRLRESAWVSADRQETGTASLAGLGSGQAIPVGWAKVETTEGNRRQTDAGMAVEVGGFVVTFGAGADIGRLAEVCRALRAI
jgi:transposase-like protein